MYRSKLINLFRPGNIGKMKVKNRIVMSPMGTVAHGPEGEITDRTVIYYAERAKGGVGFIICQSSIIMRESRAPHRPSIYDDKFIPGLRRVADAIHENGSMAAFQLVHHGRLLTDYQHMVDRPEELRILGPSPIPRLLRVLEIPGAKEEQDLSIWVRGNIPPEEATREDIKRIIKAFAEAARRVKDAGFDAVEIHGGHGYLISQFLSPLANQRTDEYGGSVEKRALFACEIIDAVKQKVGIDFPVIFRFSGSDFMPGGINIDDSTRQAPLFVEAGADALDVSASEQGSIDWQYPSFLFQQGPLVHLAEAIKKAVKVPVIAVGKIVDPTFAEEVLAQGKADFVALGRALLADPEWSNKAKEGRFDDIRACIYCLNCFNFKDHPNILREGLHCSVNPALMREKEFVIVPTSLPKKIMVVGGGPAGMEAARTLQEKGHRVTLYEQDKELGGQWYVASQQAQKKHDYPKLLYYLKRGLDKAGVKVHLGTRVTPGLVKREKPNIVVIATGASPAILDIKGIDNKNVVQANDLILGKVMTGEQVVVIGGRYLGMEIADQLAGEGKKVSLVARRSLGRDIERNIYLTLRNRLIKRGVFIYQSCPVVEIRPGGIYVIFNNDLVFLEADSVVLAVGVKPEKELSTKLKGLVPEVYEIGDCVEPRDVMWAIREGAELAISI
ncbi:MAG: FAD-dependent oxidoreductase [Desulfobacteria bacterium]